MNDIKLSEIMQHIISHACNADHRSNGHITIKQALAMYNIITTKKEYDEFVARTKTNMG